MGTNPPTERAGRGGAEDRERVAVALGGNTVLSAGGPWTAAAQRAAVAETAGDVATLLDDDREVLLTHGNCPQVGNLLEQQEQTPETPQVGLDVLVAETQARVGYLLQQALARALADRRDGHRSGGERDVATLVTRTIVDGDDPAFDDPTKPVGPYYTPAEAAARSFETREVRQGGDGGGADDGDAAAGDDGADAEATHRRVVPSPDPRAVVETAEVDRLLAAGDLVVAAGGGGVPVVREDGGLSGVEAVVDKDLATQRLATALGVERLVLLTDVEYAYVDYGEPTQTPLRAVDPDALREHLTAGEFEPGTMRPKVEACCRFVESSGDLAAITTPAHLADALAGASGTRVTE
ncbi:MAG: carbamate kinase [Halobacteriaceae archaeon]